MYMDDHDQFISTARFWTETYAKERSTDDAAVSRLTDMGFPAVRLHFLLMDVPMETLACGPNCSLYVIPHVCLQDQAKAALLACQGDESAAIERLLSSM